MQGTGFFTKDSENKRFRQDTTHSGGVLASYRFRINNWFAADGSYGYTRGTQHTFTPAGAFNVQSNVHQATGALVITSLRESARLRRKEERYAEVLGHELAHAADILLNPELALQVEELIEQTNELLLIRRRRSGATFFIGAEMAQRIENRDSLLQRLETYAEIMETRVWRELRATQQARKRS